MEPLAWLVPLFFATAFFYSLAGFGGGSTYLALLVLAGVPFHQVPQVALICNLTVVTGSCLLAYQAGYLKFFRVLPWILTSIPGAFLGGRVTLSEKTFFILLAFCLLVAAIRLIWMGGAPREVKEVTPIKYFCTALLLGALLGVLSGLVGIGGGIFLSPLLLTLGWGRAKEVAATAACFIWVNSFSGLLGQWSKGVKGPMPGWVLPLVLAVLVGGQLGSRISFGRLADHWVARTTGVLVVVVAIRILGGYA